MTTVFFIVLLRKIAFLGNRRPCVRATQPFTTLGWYSPSITQRKIILKKVIKERFSFMNYYTHWRLLLYVSSPGYDFVIMRAVKSTLAFGKK